MLYFCMLHGAVLRDAARGRSRDGGFGRRFDRRVDRRVGTPPTLRVCADGALQLAGLWIDQLARLANVR